MKKQETEQNVYELALHRTRLLFDRVDRVAVSFSGGKDSTVCLNVALTVARELGALPIDVHFWDEEAISPDTVDYVRRVADSDEVRFRWYCVPIVARNACSKTAPTWYPWAPEDRERWCREPPADAIMMLPGFEKPEGRLAHYKALPLVFPNPLERVGMIMGIRAAESLRRYRSVTFRQYDNWLSTMTEAPHITIAKPIYDWTTEDVWSFPRIMGCDYNRTYDAMELAGISRHNQRVCPPFGEEPLQNLFHFAQCYPELWEKMIERVPGAAAAGRYARSPVYGFSGQVKPPDLSWQEAIRYQLSKFPSDVAGKIARRIQAEIRKHNYETGNAPIPETGRGGLTWEFLYAVAVRGDLRGRKQPVLDLNRLDGPDAILQRDASGKTVPILPGQREVK